jgi:hypothetical protein
MPDAANVTGARARQTLPGAVVPLSGAECDTLAHRSVNVSQQGSCRATLPRRRFRNESGEGPLTRSRIQAGGERARRLTSRWSFASYGASAVGAAGLANAAPQAAIRHDALPKERAMQSAWDVHWEPLRFVGRSGATTKKEHTDADLRASAREVV